jgi:hypothetical protein
VSTRGHEGCEHAWTRGIYLWTRESRDLSSSPTGRRAVRGSMKLSNQVRTMEVRGGHPGIFVIAVAFPLDEVLWGSPVMPQAKDLFDFVFDMTIVKWHGRRDGRRARKIRIGSVRPQKSSMKRIVDPAIEKGLRECQAVGDIVDTLGDCERTAELGHEFPGPGICVRGQVSGGEEDEVPDLKGTGTSMSIGLYGCGLVCSCDGGMSGGHGSLDIIQKAGGCRVGTPGWGKWVRTRFRTISEVERGESGCRMWSGVVGKLQIDQE